MDIIKKIDNNQLLILMRDVEKKLDPSHWSGGSITLNLRSKTQKPTYCIIPFYRIGKSTEGGSRLVAASGGEERGWEITANRRGVFLRGN